MRNSYSKEKEAKQFCLCRLCYEALLTVTIDYQGWLVLAVDECLLNYLLKAVGILPGLTCVADHQHHLSSLLWVEHKRSHLSSSLLVGINALPEALVKHRYPERL
jgi:hypothetical protein